MNGTRAAPRARLTLRSHPMPQPWETGLAVAGAALVLAGLVLLSPPLAPLAGLAGVAAVLPFLWATRPGPVTVIDLARSRVVEKSALGRVLRTTPFDHIEGVACDRVKLPAATPGGEGLTIHRTLLLTGEAPLPLRGFGAPGPARALKQTIEAWLAEAPAAEPAE